MGELHGNNAPLFRMFRGVNPYFKPVCVTARYPRRELTMGQLHTQLAENLMRALKALDAHLAARTFLINERITVADILVAATVRWCLEASLGAAERVQIPHVMRHFETVAHTAGIDAVFGPIEYHEQTPTYTPPAKEKKPAEAKPKEPKAEKPKAEPKPKAEKPKEPEDDDDDDGIPKEEPKAKNPLDFLPKSTFNLEDWKRAYSNMDTRGPGGSLEWLYKKCAPCRSFVFKC
jgi:elongation factor 1-gamma